MGDKRSIKVTYSNLSVLDSATGNCETAYDDYKNYIIYRDSVFNQGTTRIEISYEFERREDSIRGEYEKENIIKTAEIKRKKILNDAAIIILALIILLAILLINRQQIKRKKEKLFFEKELANAKAMLEDYVKNMVEKNKLLEQFKVDNINLYPNLNTGQCTLSGLQQDMILEMYDYTGKMISRMTTTNESMQLNIFNQANGVYLTRILDKDGNLIGEKKVVKTQ